MWKWEMFIFFTVFSGALGSAFKTSSDHSMEENIIELKQRMDAMEDKLLSCSTMCSDEGYLEKLRLHFDIFYANASYVSKLDENLRNLDKTTKAKLQSITDEFYPRIKQMEENGNVTEIKKTLANHSSEIISLNTRLLQVETVCDPPCQNEGKCGEDNICICKPLFSGERCQNDYPQCGLELESLDINRGRPIRDNSNSARAWPWMAAVYCTEEGGRSLEPTFQCGGSIIHQHYVLTVAHCMYHSTGRKRESSEITVKLGLTDLRNLTYLEEFQVLEIHVHPEFDRSVSYDYDIALLKLERPIDYNLFIRPVCLPPKEASENTHFYEPLAPAQAIGWGHKGKMKKFQINRPVISRVLKEIDLVIQPPNICQETLRDENLPYPFTDRMFCAAEVGKYFTCLGDGGGPSMQSHLRKDGRRIWTQVGIVSWGIGCGLENVNGFYSHLQKLMPWVNTTIEAS